MLYTYLLHAEGIFICSIPALAGIYIKTLILGDHS